MSDSAKPPREVTSVATLEKLGRVRLSEHFFMREMLYSEIANFEGLRNYPTDIPLAIEAGSRLCQELLEPLRARFGHIVVRSAFRSETVNDFGNRNKLNCGSNEANWAGHIWDRRDANGNMGATATIQVHAFAERFERGELDWPELAWWIHDHLPYHLLYFFPKRAAFNIRWREKPERWIKSYVRLKGVLTRPGMDNWEGDHSVDYTGLLKAFPDGG